MAPPPTAWSNWPRNNRVASAWRARATTAGSASRCRTGAASTTSRPGGVCSSTPPRATRAARCGIRTMSCASRRSNAPTAGTAPTANGPATAAPELLSVLNNPLIGWALAALAVAVGYLQWGWQGVVLAVTVIVFWLLLQFSRALRVLRNAGQSPVGEVPNAVMLHAKLQRGQRLPEILRVTKSLGKKVADDPETFEWR